MRSRNEELPLEVEIQHTQEELHIHEGLTQALRDPHAILDVVLQAEDSDAAQAALRSGSD